MIPNLAIIVSAYALARLLCEYIFTEPETEGFRKVLAGVAILAIAVGLFGILSASASLDI